MERVGHHLQKYAWGLSHPEERDIFGRSAYNRYYYAAFLRARKMMTTLDAKSWSALPHKNYPPILKSTIKKKLHDGIKKSTKIDDHKTAKTLQKASTAALEMARLMETAYAARVIADYEPDVSVKFLPNQRFSLNGIDITTAHQWFSKVDTWAKIIEEAWSQLNA